MTLTKHDNAISEQEIEVETNALQLHTNLSKGDARKTLKKLFRYLKSDEVRLEGVHFAQEFAKILQGKSEITPDKDPRFKDESWKNNFVYKRWGQSYLAFCHSIENLLNKETEDWKQREQARFVYELVTSTFSPTNNLLGNPEALKEAFHTRGKSLGKGLKNFVDDVRHHKLLPSQVDASPYKVGENMAASPGAVIYRNEQMEILQYSSNTPQVYRIPIFIIPPQINKYYFLDLSPGRSFVEYLVSQGYQVFIASWRNPETEHHDWGLDSYCNSLSKAVDVVRQVSGSKTINTIGFCAGGLTMSALLAGLEEKGQGHKINSISYAVTLMDFSYPSMIGMFRIEPLIAAAKWNTQRSGVMSGATLGNIFSLLRPNDLIWKYWVNNYLMGKPAPSFDILAWNTHSTNLPAQLHEDFMNVFLDNLITKPGSLKVNGTPVDLKKVKQDAFVTAAINDHLTPWAGCYQTTQLLGGDSTFVLSSAGHIAGLVNPPGNPKATYMAGPKPGSDHEQWLAEAEQHKGSWWECWSEWASTRSGDMRRAKTKLGSSKYPALEDAPGSYVHT